ncbi:glycosyltransferase [Corynebacterium sp. Marseille-P4611]|uniref:glycosyltransferase family protein n=1 Tax=Corynebacterium sp. Marseille-P4611 TaxID=2866575 RepID=UPI001CE470D7|nr:glycosyltransferase [Corynebacterium sp. Marseille-P4611]
MKTMLLKQQFQMLIAVSLALGSATATVGYLLTGTHWLLLLCVILYSATVLGIFLVAIRGMNASIKAVHTASRSEAVLLEQNSQISDSARKIKLLNPVIRNTAGSVGKMAPNVRKLVESGKVVQLAASSQAREVENPPQKVKFPPIPEPADKSDRFPKTVMVIADDFTANAFSFEWNQIQPTKENWLKQLDENDVDLLFVESAWEGNSGEWRYQLTGSLAPRPEIQELVAECKKRGIPTAFWNKEDPPHFEDFLRSAALFDYIFTTDVNKVDDYKRALGHNRIKVLPFAAQPKIHNPAHVKGVERSRDVVFGGMYFRHKYPERRAQMDFLLPAASKFGLDIFSRQLGTDPNYQFPSPYDSHVRGSLPYPSMLTAYHAYKTVLNVNSVVGSPSMCARRILEATACGAAVVTPYTPAIEMFYPNKQITVVRDEQEAYQKLRILIRSKDFRERKVHLAQRNTWKNHTYRTRAVEILNTCGIEVSEVPERISVISPTIRPENVDNIFQNFARQSFRDKELLVACHGFALSETELQNLKQKYEIEGVVVLSAPAEATLADNLNAMINAATGDVIARMDDDDWYGEYYLEDMYNSLQFSQADVVGKAASYIYFQGSDMTVLTMPNMEHKYSQFVRGATIMARKETFVDTPFPNGKRGEDSDFLTAILEKGGRIYSTDRFNFSVTRLAEKESHTWAASDDLLFGTGEMKYIGQALDQISV